MKTHNTTPILINSIKILNNHKVIHYSKHISNGDYMHCVKAVPYVRINIKWI